MDINEAYAKAKQYAQNTIIPSSCDGGYFDRETGELKVWSQHGFNAGTGMIFLHYTEFKFRGTPGQYIEHLEQLVNEAAEMRQQTEAERLLRGVVQHLEMGNSVDRHCGWGKDVIAWSRQ